MSPTPDWSNLFNSVSSVNRFCPLRGLVVLSFLLLLRLSTLVAGQNVTWMVPKRNTILVASFFAGAILENRPLQFVRLFG